MPDPNGLEGDAAAYYTTFWNYLHLNPWRAGLIGKRGSILDYPWSSIAGGFALPPTRRPTWLAGESVFQNLDYPDTAKGRRELVETLDGRGRTEGKRSGMMEREPGLDGRLSHLSRGWYWGAQEFAERVSKMSSALDKPGRSRAMHRTPERRSRGESLARELLETGLKKEGLTRRELTRSRASDPRKVAIAREIWKQTTVSQAWIAKELGMRTAASVSLCIHRKDKMQENAHLYPVARMGKLEKISPELHAACATLFSRLTGSWDEA